ncbi:hypothetical protein MCC00328_15130 [Bifidobacterium longum subsp. longum]|nr:hypothetical protein MCC00328_15130 [Bifidobacterium longum subsp. longum]
MANKGFPDSKPGEKRCRRRTAKVHAGTNITNHIERKTSDVRTQDYRNPRHRRRDPEGNVNQ